MHSTEHWTARVSIRWEYDSQGKRLNDVQEVPFGLVLTHTEDVETTLRRAQCAVLSPGISPNEFLMKSAEDLSAMSNTFQRFSNNVVCIDISGPELTNLDFVDLPGERPLEWRKNLLSSVRTGLIQNASSEVVSFIENMVTSHIKGNCIILVTLPMSGT